MEDPEPAGARRFANETVTLEGDGDGRPSKKEQPAAKGALPKAVDTQTSERIETLEKGVGRALEEVRDLLQMLE